MDKALSDSLFPCIDRVLELINKTESEKDDIVIGIDGSSGAGKSCLAELLVNYCDCNVIHMDDFFLQPRQRTAARLKEPGGNIDYERFQSEVINNLKSNREFCYRIYDCSKAALTDWVKVIPKKINIIEGVYSMHPLWNHIYDIKIFLTVKDDIQLERIRKRNGDQMLKRFVQEWIPLENQYFEYFKIAQLCDIVIDTSALKSSV